MLLVASFLLVSCDKWDNTYHRGDPVRCVFEVINFPELQTTLSTPPSYNYGQYAFIRTKIQNGVEQILVQTETGTAAHNPDRSTQYFIYGLGGIVVGTNYNGEYLAYDWACPNCATASRRINYPFDGTGIATCPKCHTSYDLNNYGAIVQTGTLPASGTPRGLFRYHITYNGMLLNIFN